MTCNYAQGSYSAQYDDNCMRGFYRSLPTLASKLLFLPISVSSSCLSHPPVCLSSCLPVSWGGRGGVHLSHLSALVHNLMNISK